MDTKTETAENAETKPKTESVAVLCRFEREELDAMRHVTGANADATAVACFCRQNLRGGVA